MGAAKMKKTARGEAARAEPGSANPTVLVVDDDRQVTHVLAVALQRWGYVALQANSGAEALKISRDETIDAALIDVRMPGADGFRVLQALKQNDELLVAVLMTGYSDLDEARRAMGSGAYDYITKPFDLAGLQAILQTGLTERANASVHRRGKKNPQTVLIVSCR